MRQNSAYTLIEVLVAAGLLLLVVGAAASLSLAITAQEEMSARAAVALNQQEQAGRLWRLGLSQSEILAILPPADVITGLTIAESSTNFPGIGTLLRGECTVSFRLTRDAGNWTPLSWTAGSREDAPQRTNSMVLLRPVTP